MIKKDLLLTDDERVARGDRARSLIGSDSYKEGMQEMYDGLHAGLDCLPINDIEVMTSIVNQLRSLKSLHSKFESWVQESRRLSDD